MVTLVYLELTMETKLAFNSERSTHLLLHPECWIKGAVHHGQPVSNHLQHFLVLQCVFTCDARTPAPRWHRESKNDFAVLKTWECFLLTESY